MNETAVQREALLRLIDDGLVVKAVRAGVAEATSSHESAWSAKPFDVIACVPQGRLVLYWGRTGQVVARTGEAILIPAGLRRRSLWQPEGSQMAVHWAHLDVSVLHGAVSLFSLFQTPATLAVKETAGVMPLHAALVESLAANQQESFGDVCRQKGLALELMAAILPHLSVGLGCRSVSLQTLAAVFEYVDAHWREPVSVEEMAARSHLSVSRFHRVFKETTGMTPQAYVRRRRLDYAAACLHGTDHTLAHIAADSGFADQFHLSRLFKQAYGVSPSAFRKRVGVDFL